MSTYRPATRTSHSAACSRRPGTTSTEMIEMHDVITEKLRPLWQHEAGSPEALALPGGGIDQYFFVALNGFRLRRHQFGPTRRV